MKLDQVRVFEVGELSNYRFARGADHLGNFFVAQRKPRALEQAVPMCKSVRVPHQVEAIGKEKRRNPDPETPAIAATIERERTTDLAVKFGRPNASATPRKRSLFDPA